MLKLFTLFCLALLLMTSGCNFHHDAPELSHASKSRSEVNTPSQLPGGEAGPAGIETEEIPPVNESDVLISRGVIGNVDVTVRQSVGYRDMAIMEMSIPKPWKECQSCLEEDGTYQVHIKLSAPLAPGYTLAIMMDPNRMFDSVFVAVPQNDSLVITLLPTANFDPATLITASLDLMLYVQNGSGVSLPAPGNLISGLRALCGGVEVVVLDHYALPPDLETWPPEYLFRGTKPAGGGHYEMRPEIWHIAASLWHFGTVPSMMGLRKFPPLHVCHDEMHFGD